MTTPKLPPWAEPMFDDRGQMTIPWRTWFEQVVDQLEDHEDRIEALEP
ncbi:MAG: hypothetical protein ACOY4K_00575 [Pseudomonadota bacterium]